MPVDVYWFENNVTRYLTAAQRAHTVAVLEAAGEAARAIGGQGTGALARDVSRPRTLAPLISEIGSDLPYAAIQHFGGTITPKNFKFLYIRGKTGLSGYGAPIAAVATEVHIPAKHYLDRAIDHFSPAFMRYLALGMPR